MIQLLKKIFGSRESVDLKTLYQNGAVIVDVRTPGEFKSGHIKGAINVPLQNLHNQVSSLKKLNKPVITCCLSGGRSGAAKNFLRQQGLEVYNGGGWASLQAKIR
ncbi:MAG TPA: rhodanese-like domain-containing protein [Chitinophagaceae bacterium]|jgi:rhodanese-related sulfurtransferase|nr:rhodanese-like domain-containing protein [Chitinophagaceae bacterium]